MKALFFSLVLLLTIPSAQGQGQVGFANLAFLGKPAALVTDWDGKTGLAGPGFLADLYWAPGTVSDSSALVPLNQPAPFYELYSWWQPGLFADGLRTFPGFVGQITCQLRVWDLPDGSSWEECATNRTSGTARVGESALFQILAVIPPSAPYFLTWAMPPFSLHQVPFALPPAKPKLYCLLTSPTTLSFFWPAYYGAWKLQQNADLNTTNWVDRSEPPILFAFTREPLHYRITIQPPLGTMFYRLAQ